MLDLIIFLILIFLGYTFGKIAELRHYKSIRRRELKFINLPTTNQKFPMKNKKISKVELKSGSIVVSVDYFKRIYAGVINIFGGKIVPYETLLDRGRREAILRLKESALNADEIINLRMETSSITKNSKNKVGCIEVFVYATAIYYTK